MSIIRPLSHHEIAKIAAGQVVERPANIVKELIENSLDAHASTIDIYARDGGHTFIRVVDNGCGMDADDALACFDQHATSKITTIEDLERIETFGFRGEALASIGAIAKVTLKTKQPDAPEGSLVTVEGGTRTNAAQTTCPDGTDIWVDDIFFNVPARKKFLKAPETEWRHIHQLFHAFTLCHQNVHWRLFHNDALVYNCPPVDSVLKRTMQIWDIQTANHLLHINGTHEATNTRVAGVASNHILNRYNTSQIFFFVNNRLVKNSALVKAFVRAYAGVHQPGKYPVGCMFILTDQQRLDVNIDPRKEEVRFLNEHAVLQLVQSAVSNALEKDVSQKLGAPMQTQAASTFIPAWSIASKSYEPQMSPITDPMATIEQWATTQPAEHTLQSAQEPSFIQEQHALVQPGYRLLGQLFDTYILIERDKQLIMIDQHAAHERVLYERFQARTQELAGTALANPVIVTLDNQDLAVLLKHSALLEQYGIIVDRFAPQQLIVRQIPTHIRSSDIQELIRALAADLIKQDSTATTDIAQHIEHALRARMACKAAVKAGDRLTPEHIHALISDLEKTENHLTCPHGRPTIWTISISELERTFKRIG